MKVHERKIQSFARYSYAITLPINWVKKNHLTREKVLGGNGSKGISSSPPVSKAQEDDSIVNIFEMPDGSLRIFPSLESSAEEDSFGIVDLDEIQKMNKNFIKEKSIQMILISYYMNGSKGIEIVSSKPIPNEIISQIERTQTRLLFNWNYSKLSNRRIIIKNVFQERAENIFQEEIPRFLRESFSILLGIIEDLVDAIENDQFESLIELQERDDKIDRYYFFTVRQIRTIFENPQISRPLNYSHKKIVDLRLLTKFIEDVGDLLKDSADILYHLHHFFEEIELKDYLLTYFKILYKNYSLLADKLRDSVQEHAPSVGMNYEIMDLIQEFRGHGTSLLNLWQKLAPNMPIKTENYTFLDYYQGARLVNNLEDIFKKIFDFTNLFF